MGDPLTELDSLPLTRGENLTTLQNHILAEQARHNATGTLSWILSALSFSGRVISAKIRRARLQNVQQKLDVIANETLLRCLGTRAGVAIVASEENEEPIVLRRTFDGERPYVVLFDPLDGSSNIDTGAAVGTIFSVLRYDRRGDDPMASLLQRGAEQVAAGYILYGSSTIFVLTTGNGVSMFVLDPSIGAFLRVADGLRIPQSGKIYSCNEGNRLTFPDGYQRYLDWAQSQGYSTRYSGTMVADVHRILLKGGVFLYPPTKKAPEGKLRLLYEGNPMAMIVEQAGGKAYAGATRLMERAPSAIHQRTSVVMGSPDEVDHVLRHLG
jgi:fructose-1,6-bisphosphatase I